jgi:perosamine synthetase
MDDLAAIAHRHNLVIIEDACEAIGAEFGDPPSSRRAGSFGDLSVFGFYPNKQLTTGEGGAVLARDPIHVTRLRSLRNQGRGPQRQVFVDRVEGRVAAAGKPNHLELGYNYRLSEMACALGRVQLSRIEEILALRRAAAERYHMLLGAIPGLELPPLALPRRVISWFVFVVRLPLCQESNPSARDRVQSSLATRGIATGRYFAPIHLQTAWRNHDGAAPAMTVTESIANRILAVPLFNRITLEQQAEVAAALEHAIRSET